MPIIETLTGEINLRKQSAKCYVFHSPRKGSAGNSEVFLDAASKNGVNSAVVRRVGTPDFFAAIPGTKQDIGGRFIRQKFDLDEGEIIKVFVNVRGGYGERPKDANFFLRVRQGAAHRKIRVALINHPDAAATHAEIEGTFDLLSLDDVEASLKAFPPALRIFGNPSAVEKVLTENTIIQAEETAPVRLKKTVTVAEDGEKKVSFTRRKRRGLKF